MSSRWLALIGAMCVNFAVGAQSQPMPSPVPDVVARAQCLTCHGTDLIQQQRLSRSGWERELDKMIRWGASVAEADRSQLLEYLEASRGSVPPSGTPGTDRRGADLVSRLCVGCHGLDLIEQQRLGAAAWRREVGKMVGWGAQVAPGEDDLLVAYLSERFGIR